jgi:hypothetical protein
MKKSPKQQAADAASQAHVLLGEVLSAHTAIDSIGSNPARWKTWSEKFKKSLDAHPHFVVEDAKSLVQLLRSAPDEKSIEAYHLITNVVAYFRVESSEPQ